MSPQYRQVSASGFTIVPDTPELKEAKETLMGKRAIPPDRDKQDYLAWCWDVIVASMDRELSLPVAPSPEPPSLFDRMLGSIQINIGHFLLWFTDAAMNDRAQLARERRRSSLQTPSICVEDESAS
jgi:hypothetical protein